MKVAEPIRTDKSQKNRHFHLLVIGSEWAGCVPVRAQNEHSSGYAIVLATRKARQATVDLIGDWVDQTRQYVPQKG